tara:strand:+ start:1767 stop:1928 length:162 start_codon:yes stop_codon:yes gene_type:complete
MVIKTLSRLYNIFKRKHKNDISAIDADDPYIAKILNQARIDAYLEKKEKKDAS